MAQWGTEAENAANSVSWVASSLSQGDGNAAQATENTNLFQNTTPDAFITGVEVGQFAVDKNEMAAARAQSLPRPAAAGWTLRTEGTGGRAGRVTFETLVAIKDTSAFITSDAGATTDDNVVPDYAVVISTQPADVASVTSPAPADFTVVAVTVPSGGTLAYAWEFSVDSGANWNPVSSATVNAATLSVLSTDTSEYVAGNLFRCVVTVTDGGTSIGVTTNSAELVAIV